MGTEFVAVKGNEYYVKDGKLDLNGREIIDISEIKGLEVLTNLKELYLSSNKIKEIKGLENLTNLKKLELSMNDIEEISGLGTLKNLRRLNLYDNQIHEIKGLEVLTNLKELYLGSNKIKEIKGLENLTNLQILSLSWNPINADERSLVRKPPQEIVNYCRNKLDLTLSSTTLEDVLSDIEKISKFLRIPARKKSRHKMFAYTRLSKKERLMRLFLDYFLPENSFTNLIEKNLAYLLAYNLIDVSEKPLLLKEWYKKRANKQIVNELLEADKVTSGKLLSLFIRRISILQKFVRRALNSFEFEWYLDDILHSWKPKLSKDEIKIIIYLDTHPFAKKEEIAQGLNIPKTDVSGIINKLKEQNRFGVYGIPNISKLGLQTVLVTLPTSVSIKFPYLTAYQVLEPERAKFYSFFIPNRIGQTDPLKEFCLALKERTECSIYQAMEIKTNRSFQFFDKDVNKWRIDWLAWSLWLESILYEDKYHMVTPDLFNNLKREGHRISFDVKDLEIIENLSRNLRMSLNELAKLVYISPHDDIETRVKRLFDEDMFSPFISLSNIGLDEQVIVFYKGNEQYLRPFEAALMELPLVFSYILTPLNSSHKILIAWLNLPPSGFIKFSNIVNSSFRETDTVWTAYRSRFRSYARQLPIKMFNKETKEWRWDENVLNQLTVLT